VVLTGEHGWQVESEGKSEQGGSVGVEEMKRESSTQPHVHFMGVRGGGRRRARRREPGVEAVAAAMVQTRGLTGGPDRFNYFLDFPKQLKLVNSKQICSIA
jgi:hypothetical protein